MAKKVDARMRDLERELGGIVLRIGRKELARRTGIEYTTLCRRLKDVSKLQLWELWLIQDEGTK